MKCRDVVELMTAYLEGALSPEDRRRFEDHLSGCDGCIAYLEQLRTTMKLMGKVGGDIVPPKLEAQLLVAFQHWKRGA